MGILKISDGTTNRRKRVPEIAGTIRIEKTSDGPYQITVPEGYIVKQSSDDDTADRLTEESITEKIDAAFEDV